MDRIVESLWSTPETDVTLYVSYTSTIIAIMKAADGRRLEGKGRVGIGGEERRSKKQRSEKQGRAESQVGLESNTHV